jgi:hypothetical protein
MCNVGCVSLFLFRLLKISGLVLERERTKLTELCVEEDGYVAPRKVEGDKGVEGKALEISAE